MAKGIILVDMQPCNKCDYGLHQDIDVNYCRVKDKHYYHDDMTPDWCPIKPAPEKIKYKNRQEIAKELIAEGWNACLDKILGE